MTYFSRNANNKYIYIYESSRNCQFYSVSYILFDLFYSAASGSIDIWNDAYKNRTSKWTNISFLSQVGSIVQLYSVSKVRNWGRLLL